jgi:hypothetical protein
MSDISLLVSQQGEQINRIEEYLEGAADYNVKAKDALKVAKETAALRQRQRFWTTIVTVVLMVVFVIVVGVCVYYKIFTELMQMVYFAIFIFILIIIYSVWFYCSPTRWLGSSSKKSMFSLPCV